MRQVAVLGQSLFLDVSETAGYLAYFERRVYEPALSDIVAGLREGDVIVVNGLLRVRPGAPVSPKKVPMADQTASAPGTSPQTESPRDTKVRE